MSCSADVALVSTPLSRPWRDGSSRLVFELLQSLASFRRELCYGAFSLSDQSLEIPAVRWWRLAPGPRLNVRVAMRLARPGSAELHHYFFAPHLLGVAAARTACLTSRATPLQTICSLPKSLHRARHLCFGRKIVVLSEWMRRRLEAVGIESSRLITIPPPLAPVVRPNEARRIEARKALGLGEDRIVVFAGDAEEGGGLGILARAVPSFVGQTDSRVIVSCRAKTSESRAAMADAKRVVTQAGFAESCRFVGPVDDFHALLATADLFVLPATSLAAKIDYPYALLEAMSLGVPFVVAEGTPPEELIAGGGGEGVPTNSPHALARVIMELLSGDARRADMGRRAGETVGRVCDPRSIAEAYLQVHLSMLDELGKGERR